MVQDKLLTSDELASILGIAQITVQRMAARGEIPGKRVAGMWRFDIQEVRTHLSQKSETENESEDPTKHDPFDDLAKTLDSIQADVRLVRDCICGPRKGEKK